MVLCTHCLHKCSFMHSPTAWMAQFTRCQATDQGLRTPALFCTLQIYNCINWVKYFQYNWGFEAIASQKVPQWLVNCLKFNGGALIRIFCQKESVSPDWILKIIDWMRLFIKGSIKLNGKKIMGYCWLFKSKTFDMKSRAIFKWNWNVVFVTTHLN